MSASRALYRVFSTAAGALALLVAVASYGGDGSDVLGDVRTVNSWAVGDGWVRVIAFDAASRQPCAKVKLLAGANDQRVDTRIVEVGPVLLGALGFDDIDAEEVSCDSFAFDGRRVSLELECVPRRAPSRTFRCEIAVSTEELSELHCAPITP